MRFAGEIDLIARLDCLVTMDSLAMHLAALRGDARRFGLGRDPSRVGVPRLRSRSAGAVQADLPCRPCSVYGAKPCRYGDYRCLTSIAPQTIVDRVAETIGR